MGLIKSLIKLKIAKEIGESVIKKVRAHKNRKAQRKDHPSYVVTNPEHEEKK